MRPNVESVSESPRIRTTFSPQQLKLEIAPRRRKCEGGRIVRGLGGEIK